MALTFFLTLGGAAGRRMHNALDGHHGNHSHHVNASDHANASHNEKDSHHSIEDRRGTASHLGMASLHHSTAGHDGEGQAGHDEVSHSWALGEFETFLAKHQPHYHTSIARGLGSTPGPSWTTEHSKRLDNFKATLGRVERTNAISNASTRDNPNRAKFGLTKFADLSDAEFRKRFGGGKKRHRAPQKRRRALGGVFGAAPAPASAPRAPCTVNWAKNGDVRDQGECGSCWLFSTAELLRSAYIRDQGTDPGKLSVEYLVNCAKQEDCSDKSTTAEDLDVNGCCGGWPGDALTYISKHGGVPTKDAYGPYTQMSAHSRADHNQTCSEDVHKAATALKWTEEFADEAAMADYVCNTGALIAQVKAPWQDYESGVLSARQCGDAGEDHLVVLVGLDAKANAWIVQNSWGSDWGVAANGSPYKGKNGGYIFLEYGTSTCKVDEFPLAITAAATGGTPPARGGGRRGKTSKNFRLLGG